MLHILSLLLNVIKIENYNYSNLFSPSTSQLIQMQQLFTQSCRNKHLIQIKIAFYLCSCFLHLFQCFCLILLMTAINLVIFQQVRQQQKDHEHYERPKTQTVQLINSLQKTLVCVKMKIVQDKYVGAVFSSFTSRRSS